MRNLLALFALCLALGLLASCSNGGGTSIPTANLVGTWKIAQIGAPTGTTGGTSTVTCPGTITLTTGSYSCTVNDTLTFNTDGTYSTLSGAAGATAQQGQWSISGSTLTTVVTSNTLGATTTVVTTYSVQLTNVNTTLKLTDNGTTGASNLIGTFSISNKQ